MKNLLLLIVDCARAEKTVADLPLASEGTRRSATLPFLDSLRRRGTTWTQYVSVSSATSPSVATMLTGLLPREHGLVDASRHARSDVATLAEILSTRGWHAHAEVTGPLHPECGLRRGFDTYRWRPRTETLDAGFGDELRALFGRLPEPWFVCVHLWEAHVPYWVPPAFSSARFGVTPHDRALSALDRSLGIAVEDVDPERTTIVWCGNHGERLAEDYEKNRELGGEEAQVFDAWRRFVARSGGALDVDAWIEHAPVELGPVLGRVYAPSVLGHGFHVTDDLVRVPLVIVDPERCAANETRDELRSQLDFLPTFLDLAGISPDEHGIEERSILRARRPDAVYVEARGGGRWHPSRCSIHGVRTKEWKYWRVEGAGATSRTLWNLAADPRETTDVAAWKPEEVARLDARLDAWAPPAKVLRRTPSVRRDEMHRPASRSLRDR